MRRVLLLTLLVSGLTGRAGPANADHRWGRSYPKVRTFSGGYYGPTQAHYQYFRRYGRPWHGRGGFSGGLGVGAVNGYPAYRTGYGAVLGGWAFPSYSYYGYVSPFGSSAFHGGYGTYAPVWGHPSPWSGFMSPLPYVPGFGLTTSPAPGWGYPTGPMNPVLSDAWDENLKQWEQPLELMPVIPGGKPALPASTPAARIRSIKLQDQGDRRLQDSDYLRASMRYRDAISAAPDRAQPHLHLAIALAGMKQFDDAIKELKVGLTLQPSWPASGVSLDVLLGPDNIISKTQLKQRIAEWTLNDVRDPDRLFLLGATLYLDNDDERGRYILETAARLGGLHEHLAVFLRQADNAVADGKNDAAPVAEPSNDEVAPVLPELPPLPTPPKEIAPPDAEQPNRSELLPDEESKSSPGHPPADEQTN